ncbi:MAG TPA: carboxypeptidase-like regulatory domain-containing protein, partial [Planctomycetota bacterium]|nr:carboxypeptidase-like regulatory domain-containing protein [Planctomycetota bacterium]
MRTRGGGAGRAIGAVVLLGALGAAGWYAWRVAQQGPAPDAANDGPAPDAQPPGEVAGIVRVRDTQRPVAGVPVRALVRRGEEWAPLGTATTDAGGRFLIGGLPPGPCRIQPGDADKPASEVSSADVVVASGGRAETDLQWEHLPEKGTVHCRGTVKFDSGRPATQFSFRLLDGRGGLSDSRGESDPATGGEAGRYAVEGTNGWFGRRLPRPGAYTVTEMSVEGEEHDYFFKDVRVVDGESLDLVVEEIREIGVVVFDADSRQPIEGARLFRHDPKDRATAGGSTAAPGPETLRGTPIVSGKGGRASLGRGRGGEIVWVVADGYAWSRATVPRGSSEDARVDLRPGGALRIRVPGWSRLDDPHLSAWPMKPDQSADDLDGLPISLPSPGADERALVEGLPTGRYLLRVHTGPWLQHLV